MKFAYKVFKIAIFSLFLQQSTISVVLAEDDIKNEKVEINKIIDEKKEKQEKQEQQERKVEQELKQQSSQKEQKEQDKIEQNLSTEMEKNEKKKNDKENKNGLNDIAKNDKDDAKEVKNDNKNINNLSPNSDVNDVSIADKEKKIDVDLLGEVKENSNKSKENENVKLKQDAKQKQEDGNKKNNEQKTASNNDIRIIENEKNVLPLEKNKEVKSGINSANSQGVDAKNDTTKQKEEIVVKEEKIEAIDKADKKKTRKTKNKLFTIFDTKKALNFNYKNVKADNYEFLENAKELIVIKELIEEQLNPEIKKKKEEEKKKQETLVSIVEKVKEKGKVYNYLRLHSLVFLSDKDWNCRVNKQIIDYKNKDNLKSDVISILRVSKGSVVFVVNNTDDKLVKKVQKLIENKVPYSSSYFIVKQRHKTYVAFKLFIGQKINLDTMKISG